MFSEWRRIDDFFMQNYWQHTGASFYPDYFGGLFWEDSDGWQFLLVQIVEGMEERAADFLEYIREFETTVIQTVPHSHNDVLRVMYDIWSPDVHPILWTAYFDHHASAIVVVLFDYSEDEKEFFKEFVSDSPMIVFSDDVQSFIGQFPLEWHDQSVPENQIPGITMKAERLPPYSYVAKVYVEPDAPVMLFISAQLEANLNGRWITVYYHFMGGTIGLLERGENIVELRTSHFIRQLDMDMPIRVVLYAQLEGGFQWHRLVAGVFP